MQNELTAERIEMAIAYWAEFYQEIGEMQNGLSGGQYELLEEQREPVITALAALRAEQERLNPQPLTWEELSGMVGEPVWTIGECCGLDGWDIIEEVYEDSVLFGRSTEQPEKWRYNLRELSGELSGCAWIAYRTKPEGSAE